MRRLLLLLALVVFLALTWTAVAQDTEVPVNPVTMGHGPEKGSLVPAWIFYWVLGAATVICSSLVIALRVLWNKLNAEREAAEIPGLTVDERAWLKDVHELVSARDEDGVARMYIPRTLPVMISKLSEMSQKLLNCMGDLGDSREDRQALRAAFETEKSELRSIYTGEVKALQAQLHQEQKERREETQQLWERNNQTTREVMTVIKDMILALENASKVIDQWQEANE